MRHLFTVWAEFAAEIGSAEHVLLVSDYDGTLTPIVSRPEVAVLSPEMKEKLRALVKNGAFSVGIISGRSLAEIKAMVGIDGLYYAGNHGLQIAGPGLDFTAPGAAVVQPVIKQLAGRLTESLSRISGVIVEDKELSLSVHYRLVKEADIGAAQDIFRKFTAPLLKMGKIRVTAGKKVWEIRPPLDWHKGKALKVIIDKIKECRKADNFPVVYLGDDATDEDAFKSMPAHGWSVFIGGDSQDSSAGYFLNSPAEVEDLLARLLRLR